MRNFLKTRVFWAWGVILALAAVVLALLPLGSLLGYESSLVLALLISLAATHLAVRSISERRWRMSPSEKQEAQVHPLGLIMRVWLGSTLRALLLLALPVGILLGNALRVKNCNLAAGFAWTLLLPGVSAFCASAVGLAAGLLVKRERRAVALAWAILGLSIIGGLGRFYFTPPVFAFDPFLGYFPGTLYDEDIAITGTLLLARGFHLLFALALLSVLGLFLTADTLRLRLHAARGRRRLALWVLLLVGSGLTAWRLEPRLGIAPDASSLARALGGRYETEHFVLLYAPTGPWGRDLALTAQDVEFRYRQLAQAWGAAPLRKITCYLFTSSEEKRRSMGAGYTQVAKPWRYEIYLQHDEWPHPVLKHELAHVFAGEAGDGLLHIARSGWRFNVGLIEGVAVALADRAAALDLDQDVKTMRLLGVEPPINQVFGAGFWALPAARAYTVAGSFVRFLLSNYGQERLRALYRSGGDFYATYGKTLSELGAIWSERIQATPLAEAALQMEAERLRAPGIMHKVCAHELALRDQVALTRAGRGDFDGALAIYRATCQDDPEDPRHLLDMLALAMQTKHEADAQLAAEQVLQHPRSSSTQRARAFLALGDLKLRRGDSSAAEYYQLSLALPQREVSARQVRARLLAARDPLLGRALARYLVGDEQGRDATLDLWRAHQVIDAAPHQGIGYYLAGRQLYQRGQFDEAQGLLERSLELPLPDSGFIVEARRQAGMAAWRAGHFAAARRHFSTLAASSEGFQELLWEAKDFLER